MLKSIQLVFALTIGYFAIEFAAPNSLTIDIPELNESSGLAFSTLSDDLLFSHNDSGDSSRLFAFNRIGKLVYELEVQKAKAKDWEDMCSFEHDGKNWLAIGDIGDNDFKRDFVSIYVLKEPNEKEGNRKRKAEVEYELKVEYPSGRVNSEALAYDPITHSFLLFSKENLNCSIFQVPIPVVADYVVKVMATHIGKYTIPLATSADISRDGQRLVICTYGPACLIDRNHSNPKQAWEISPDQLATKFFEVPPRRQGETICFSPGGNQVWLTSEHTPTPLIELELAQFKATTKSK